VSFNNCFRSRFAAALDKIEYTKRLVEATESSTKILKLIEITRFFLLGLKIAISTLVEIIGIEAVRLLLDLNVVYTSKSFHPITRVPQPLEFTEDVYWIMSLVQLCPVDIFTSSGELRHINVMTDFGQVNSSAVNLVICLKQLQHRCWRLHSWFGRHIDFL
jgi:hypothetical protein